MRNNIITMTDSYKFTHWNMYPPGIQNVYSYFEARTGARYNKTLFFGLQYLLKEFLIGCRVTPEHLENAEAITAQHLGNPKYLNKEMWQHIIDEHGGRLPVRIKAVPEGTLVPVSNVMLTIEATDPKCFQLTNHLETLLSKLWYSCTVATLSYEIRKMLVHYRMATSGNTGGLEFGLHDFGYRGVSSEESAGIGGLAHLISFKGTDTVRALEFAEQYYDAPLSDLAYSVPATEHSVMTALGRDGEPAILERLLKLYPTGILSLVIDSYDYMKFIDEAGTKHLGEIMAREGKVVFRPDSGDPVSVTLDVLNRLAKYFGTTTNSSKFKVLPPQVGVLWGDGIDYEGIRNILFAMKNAKWSTENIVFGMGGALLQKCNRDTQRFAFKSSAQQRDGVWYDIYKQPLDTSKTSKKGRLALVSKDHSLQTIREDELAGQQDKLELVFEDGVLIRDTPFKVVRANVED